MHYLVNVEFIVMLGLIWLLDGVFWLLNGIFQIA